VFNSCKELAIDREPQMRPYPGQETVMPRRKSCPSETTGAVLRDARAEPPSIEIKTQLKPSTKTLDRVEEESTLVSFCMALESPGDGCYWREFDFHE